MTDQGPESGFDIVAAASRIAAEAVAPLPGEDAEEAATSGAFEQQRVADILLQHGVDLNLAEGETIDDKLAAADAKIAHLRKRRDEAWAAESEPSVADLVWQAAAPELIRRAQKEASVLSLALLTSLCCGSHNAETDDQLRLNTVLTIVNRDELTSAEREGFLDTVEELVGPEVFAEVMQKIGTSDALEKHAVEALIYDEAARADAEQLLEMQEVLFNEFGLDNTGHEDWQALSQSLQRLVRMATKGAPEVVWRKKLEYTHDRARRLGIDETTFEGMLGRFGIARQ